MSESTETIHKNPNQPFLEEHLGSAITPPQERAKLNQSFEDFWEEVDGAPKAEKPPAIEPVSEVKVKPEPTRKIELEPGPARIPDDVAAEMERLRALERTVDATKDERFRQQYVQPVETSYLDVIREMAKHFHGSPEEIRAQFLDPLEKDRKGFPAGKYPERWVGVATRVNEA